MHPLPLSARLIGGNVTPETTPPTPPTARPARLRVGLLLPVWYLGGVERYHLALAKWTSPVIEWVGCAFIAGSMVKQQSIDALAALMPVHMDQVTGGGEARWNVVRHESEQAAIEAVTGSCDVLLTWAVQSLETRLADFRGRVIVISHGDGQWTRSWSRDAGLRATDCVAVSTDAAKAFDRPSSDVTIQPGGVELDRLAPTQSREVTRASWGMGGRVAVGYVGRFSDEKNPLQAARIVGQLGDGYVAVYHGHSPFDESKFRAEATALAGGRIVFLGTEWHTGDVYRGLDCLVQASPAEGGPLVAMEAWSCGVPLLTTDVGIVRDNRDLAACSIVIESDDLQDWCEAVVERVDRYSLDHARILATERYSAAAMATRWEEFLDTSASGPGSTLRATVAIREQLPGLLKSLGVLSLLDVPCGDQHWIHKAGLNVRYVGGDVDLALIGRNRDRFPENVYLCLDVTRDWLPQSDAILCRDLLVHLTFDQIRAAMQNILASGAKWLLATHFPGRVNVEIGPGTWEEAWRPLDLTAEPIGLPAPRYVINERCTWGHGAFADKSLGVWDLDEVSTVWRK